MQRTELSHFKEGVPMEHLFQAINNIFDFVIPVSDFFWDFPTNFSWYASIPVLGNFSLAVILLIGSGIYFTLKTGFIQVTHFGRGIRILARKKKGGNRNFFSRCFFPEFCHARGAG